MAEQIKIAELQIDNKALVASLQETKEIIEAVTAQNKRLKASGDTTSETFIKNEAQLKKLKAEYGAQIKVLNATTDSTVRLNNELQKEIKTLDAAAKNNKELKEVRNQVNASTKEGQKQIEAINKKINENTNFIKANTSDLERQKQNIGNYKSALEGISPQLGTFNTLMVNGKAVLGGLTSAFSFYTVKIKEGVATMTSAAAGTNAMTAAQTAGAVATNVLSGALKVLKYALIATGVGAIVVVLGSLVGMLANTQSGTDKVSQVMSALGAAFNVIIDRVSQFGGALVKFFSGDFEGGFNDMKTSLSGIGEEMQKEAAEAYNLEKAMQALEEKEISLIQTQAKRKQSIEELKLAAKDLTLSTKERAKALSDSIEIEKAVLNDELAIARERARISQERVAQGESTRDEIRANEELQAKVTELATESTKRLKAIETERQSILKQGRALETQHAKEREAEALKKEAEQTKADDQELKRLEKFEDLKRQALEDAEMRKLEDEQAREELKVERDIEKKERDIEKLKLDHEQQTELLLLLEQEKIDALDAVNDKYIKEKAKKTQEAEDSVLKMETANNNSRLALAQNISSTLISLFGEAAAAKVASLVVEGALAIAQIKINEAQANAQIVANTQIAVAKAMAASPVTLGQPLAGAAIAQGAASIGLNKAASTLGIIGVAAGQVAKGLKFANGGILSGASHANGGISTPYGELEGGEAVINKRSTALFRPILSKLNEAGGGVKFASGGILDSANVQTGAGLVDYDLLADKIALANMSLPPARVAVSEIAEVSNRVGIIESAGDF